MGYIPKYSRKVWNPTPCSLRIHWPRRRWIYYCGWELFKVTHGNLGHIETLEDLIFSQLKSVITSKQSSLICIRYMSYISILYMWGICWKAQQLRHQNWWVSVHVKCTIHERCSTDQMPNKITQHWTKELQVCESDHWHPWHTWFFNDNLQPLGSLPKMMSPQRHPKASIFI